jgi:lysophospholipase L1-like esterase
MNGVGFMISTRLAASIVLGFLGLVSPVMAQPGSPLEGVRRVVFLGDSITYSGQYIEIVEAYLRVKNPGLTCEVIDLGLPSETVSGLSEPGHAGGKFPRPELRERLDRVLEKLKPDLVIACYGMNDGIYYPFSEERFQKYQEGMRHLRSRVEGAGAKILHLTPPVFDPLPIKGRTLPGGLVEYRQPFEGYDVVLDRYSGWLLAQRPFGWNVVDIHGPMTIFINQARTLDPNFRLAGDGVHIDSTGHGIIARQILLEWGVPAEDLPEASSAETFLKSSSAGSEILELVKRKLRILKEAWLTETGHKRPGMDAGLPLDQAREKATEIEREIRKLLKVDD